MQLFTVAEIAEYLRGALDRDPVLRDLWVNGEVSNLSRSSAGHAYFTLKEGTAAAIRCVLFRGNYGADLLNDGEAVNVHGRISLYEARGDLQLYVDMVQPVGLGILALELERLRVRLEAEGLFEPSRKRPLPAFPQRIGVVTSEQGSVFHDICNVVGRRYPLAEIVLCPATVQGEQAVSEVVDALRTLDAQGTVDVIILARGGGSLEDLWAFNTEAVARALYASRVPVVSAVGHETDVSIADMVADYRAPTPSSAAVEVTPDLAVLLAGLSAFVRQARSTLSYLLEEQSSAVDVLVQRMERRPPDVAGFREGITGLLGRSRESLRTLITRSREQASSLEAQLRALDPTAILRRGYAVLVAEATGTTVTSTAQVQPGDLVEAIVNDGRFHTLAQLPDSSAPSGSNGRRTRKAVTSKTSRTSP